MGLLDYADSARKKLAGLLGDMPLVQMAQGRAEMPTMAGLLGALKGMPVFSPDAGQSAYEAALNIGPMGLGKIVYHGSPHKFDKFDASKIGTGEGAQAYGHGVYLADEASVAGGYTMAGRNKGVSNFDSVNRMADRAFGFGGGDKAKALQYLDDEIAKTSGQSKKVNLQLAKQSIERGDHAASIYKADLPDEWIPKMLDWDKPLREQPENVRAALNGLAKHDKVWARHLADNDSMTGEQIYKALANVEAGGAGRWDMPGNSSAATEYIRSIGIPGIRYLDGGSRGKGKGSYNYVVFPGLEDQVKILERNGIPLSGLLGGQ